MSRLEEQRAARARKRQELLDAGVDPYPAHAHRTHTSAQVREDFSSLAKRSTPVTVAGRVRALRPHGGTTFLDLEDGQGRIQIVLERTAMGEDAYTAWGGRLDLGDIIECTGAPYATKRGEQSIRAATITLLTKSLRPIPEQHFGLKDVETRLRKRYLDLLVNADVRALFMKKAHFWGAVRAAMQSANFLEVETPVLEHTPGGAEAQPFRTHYHALDEEVTLRISLELPLKRLLVGGFEKVFEMGRIFRNEGMSPEHLQDYTQLEFYWAFADYHDLMEFLPDFYRSVIKATTGSLRVTYDGVTLDWGKQWRTYDYYELFKEHVGIDLDGATEKELLAKAKAMKVQIASYAGRGRLIDALYKKAVRPTLIQPGFLLNPPVDIEPLAKRDPAHPGRAQRLQVVAWGTELGKGFSELNDPVDQRERFASQMALRAAGDAEAQALDEDFVEALEYGMPPAAGFGLSERLFAYLVDLPIRETVLFPPMKKE